MSTDLVPYNEYEVEDGWNDAADEASERILRGTLLKFADWRWTAGQDARPMPEGKRLVAVGTAAAWVRWSGGKPGEHRVRRPGEQMAARKELGDTDEAFWEKGPDGKPRDPWQNTRYVYFVDPDTAEAYTFSTSSSGGRGAVSDLGDQIHRKRFSKRGVVPLVELGAAPMKTKFGNKSKPLLKVIEWIGGASPGTQPKQIEQPLAKEPVRRDMDDEIPF